MYFSLVSSVFYPTFEKLTGLVSRTVSNCSTWTLCLLLVSASLIQFITFSRTLVHKSIEIHGSGSTGELSSPESTYETLCRFSNDLQMSDSLAM